MICLFQGGGEHVAEHPAPVDKERNVLPRALVTGGKTGKSGHHWPLRIFLSSIKAADLLGHLQPIDLDQDTGELSVSRCRKDLSSFAEDAEADLGISQRILFEHMVAMAYLGVAAFEKFEAGWYRAKEIAHGERRALRRGRCAHRRDLSIAGADLRALCSLAMPAQQRDIRHSRDTGQRLPAKTERADMLQVVDLRHFTGSMTLQGQLQFIAGNAAAVVSHANELEPAIRQVNANLRSSGIDTILNEFFNNRGGPLNDLARGNFRGNIRRKLTYWHKISSPENIARI